MMTARPNLWKYSTLLLASALAFSHTGSWFAEAGAAAPRRLSAALASLHACKRHLEDARNPPAGLHNQSITAVSQAIVAVEKEIKGHEDALTRSKGTKEKDKDHEKDREKTEKAKHSTAEKPSSNEKSASKKSTHSATDETENLAHQGLYSSLAKSPCSSKLPPNGGVSATPCRGVAQPG